MIDPASLWWTSTDGLRLHALDWGGPRIGDGAPIIGLPGLTRTARDFAPLASWLGARRRIIGVDLRGRGQSELDPDPQRYTMPTYVGDLDRLLDALGVSRAVLVGGSNGGIIAALYAAQQPERVAGLVFNDVAHRFQPEAFVGVRDTIRSRPSWSGWAEATEAMIASYGAVHPRYDRTAWEDFARRTLRETADGTVVPDFDPQILVPLEQPGGPPSFDLLPVFTASRECPSLLLHGELSRFLTATTAAEFVAALPHVEQVDVPNVGHLPDLAEPESRAAIERLLARVEA